MALERGAGAERHDGDVVGVAEGEQATGFLAGLDEGHGVGHGGRLGVLTMAVLLAQGGIGGDALAQELAGLR